VGSGFAGWERVQSPKEIPKGVAGVGDDADLRRIVLGDLLLVDVDVDYPRHGALVDVPEVQPRSHTEQDVGVAEQFLHRRDDVVDPEMQRMLVGDDALALLIGNHRSLKPLGDRDHLRRRAGSDRTAPREYGGSLRLAQQARGIL
jgi:hypothetical protein